MPDQYFNTASFSFVWDSEKNVANIEKHGINFETAALVFDDDLRLEFPDPDSPADEERYDTIGLVHDVLFVVYCDRDNKRTGDVDIRMISARRATKYEIEAYNNNVSGRR